jgi:negative regulator of flagellin synthesis FlgM
MEITPKDSVNIEAYVNQVQEKDKVAPTSEQPENQQAKADTVELSDMGKSVQEAHRQLETIPDIREAKIAQLKEQVENGYYEIDAEIVSDIILRVVFIKYLT